MHSASTTGAAALAAVAGLAVGAAGLMVMAALGSAPAERAAEQAVDDAQAYQPSASHDLPRAFQAQPDGSFTEAQIAQMTPEEVWANLAPIAACFSPDNPPSEKIQGAVLAAMDYAESVGERHNLITRWSFASQNTQDTITWSFVPDGLFIPNAFQGEQSGPSETFSRFNQLFGNNTQLWIAQFENSFDRWAELIGVNYVRETVGGNEWDDGANWSAQPSPGVRGMVRIATKPIDGSGGVLAYNSFPSGSGGTRGNMVLDRQESWQSSAGTFRFLRNVIMHEHGHGLGFAHLCPAVGQTLMEPFINTSFDGPQHDDIRGGHFGYGDVFEPSNNPSQAVQVGLIAPGSPVTIGPVPSPNVTFGSLVSLDRTVDQDWFEFNTSNASAVNVTLTPVGRVYQSGQQASNGACPSGPTIDSRAIQDLAFQVVDANGSTVLATVNNTGAGGTESISDLFIGGPGTFYVRVYSNGGTNDTQLYNLSVSVSNAECGNDGDCDDGDPCNGVEICIDGICFPGEIVDCNNNGIDDACDIASGFSQDCNGNGIPDECDVLGQIYSEQTGNLGELGGANSPTVTFDETPEAGSTVTLTLEARGQFAAAGNSVLVLIDNTPVGSLLVNGANCPAVPDLETLPVDASIWNSARDSNGDVSVVLLVQGASGFACLSDGFSRLSVAYTATPFSQDTNGNGIPDECEDLEPVDCPFDITGPALDGVPDGIVSVADLNYYLGLWLDGDMDADVTGPALDGIPDGIVTTADLNFFVGGWLDSQGACE
ncbi:MAG: hypothetical protein EA378_00500 [Phycisphaerales bacterium]|nr:MAG: hypothetical protein EA378_00500 [Phycisphaerales bacterium]